MAELRRLLAPIEQLDAHMTRHGLLADILAYVEHGVPASVLTEISPFQAVGQRLRIAGHVQGSPGQHGLTLYQSFDAIPTEFLLRWGRLLAATYSSLHGRPWLLDLPGGTHEIEALLMHASGTLHGTWTSRRPVAKALTATGMEKLLVGLGLPPAALLIAAFTPADAGRWGQQRRSQLVGDLVGYGAAVERHRDALRPALRLTPPAQRLHVIAMLASVDDAALCHFTEELAELATSGSKQVRQAAEGLLRRTAAAGVAPLQQIALNAKPEQRLYALRQLWQMGAATGNDALTTFARETAQADKAASVRALEQEWASTQRSVTADADRYQYAMPVTDWTVIMTPDLDALLQTLWREADQSIQRTNAQIREHFERAQAQGPVKWTPGYLKPYGKADIQALRDYLTSGAPTPIPAVPGNHRTNFGHALPGLRALASHQAVSPAVLIKALAYFGGLVDNSGALGSIAISALTDMYQTRAGPSLLEVAQRLKEMDLDASNAVIRAYCHRWSSSLLKKWPNDAVWPFFAHYLDDVLRFLDPSRTRDYAFDRRGLYLAIATLPEPPSTVINALYDLALGSGKQDRPLAQAALVNLTDKEVRVIAALASGKAELRTTAAQWLGQLRHAPATAALEKAVAIEKLDVPKGAMLDALQALGQPVEKYLDRESLTRQAAKSLAKGEPKELAWFPWNALPELSWADSGESVPPSVVRWFLVQAAKQKAVEPNALLRKYCSMFAARGREALGQFVLETWIAEDIRPIDGDEALRIAVVQATSMHAQAQRHPSFAQTYPQYQGTIEEITARILPNFVQRPAGSAVGSKGVLAVAAACAGDRAAAPVARYLKQYYGTRASQGKSLITLLSWIESPSATQLMLSIGNRFRTKSFQAEAEKQAAALADRKGWTMDELADRTIPSAGFDESGMLELDFGPRTFSARLQSDFSVELFSPDGKKITALPPPRQDDDADLAKDARKAWSTVKKELKNIVAMQSERLYEALCIGRNWPFDDWQGYLAGHPVMRHLTQRLVWSAWEAERLVATFRPLEDGTLTDNHDEAIHLATDASITIAHHSHLSPEDVAGWQQHLVDYEITPLFQQFGKGTYALPEGKTDLMAIEDFQGYLLETFALRSRATKLGYSRGATEDGGWFATYEKRYTTLGVVCIIEFTGNPLPETNRTVALLKLSFTSTQNAGWQRPPIPMGEIPSVLLSESFNDMRLIAADGPGFDPQWQKKSQY